MSFTVITPNPIPDRTAQTLRQEGIEIRQISGPEKADLIRDIVDADALVVFISPNYTIDREIIDAGKKLKVIARFGVGLDNIDLEYAESKGIIVTNTPTSNSNSVAELTLFLLLAVAKKARIEDQGLRVGNWEIRKNKAIELSGKTLGIIGIGHIGSLVARKAKYGLDMHVIGWNPHEGRVFPEEIERVKTLDELLEQSDFISLHVPETSETIGLIGSEELAKLRQGAVLINTSRGKVVDENALVEALKQGKIAGAGLDVFSQEPIEQSNPLLSFDNVVLTPHYGGFSDGAVFRTWEDVADSILAVYKGQRPRFIVKDLH